LYSNYCFACLGCSDNRRQLGTAILMCYSLAPLRLTACCEQVDRLKRVCSRRTQQGGGRGLVEQTPGGGGGLLLEGGNFGRVMAGG